MKKPFFLLFFVLFLIGVSCERQDIKPDDLKNTNYLERVKPESVGINSNKLSAVDNIINKSINDKIIPGAVLAVVKNSKMAYIKAYGNKAIYPKIEKMEINTIFDLASASKPLGAAISIMQLIENGKLKLTDNVNKYIPDFKDYKNSETGEVVAIEVIDLLTHSSGLPSYAPTDDLVKKYGSPNPAKLMEYISNCKRYFKPKSKFQYSCLNFITLQNIVQNITGITLAEYAKRNIYDVLNLKYTMYNPPQDLLDMIAPTTKLSNGTVLRGKVHDPLARLLNGGNSGNAGLFSNADELAIISAALINGGELDGKRILNASTVETMTKIPAGFESIGRSLGWDNTSDYSSNIGKFLHKGIAYGHTGYTGTSVVIDPIYKIAIILLTNRVHPQDKGSVVNLRANVADAVATAIIP